MMKVSILTFDHWYNLKSVFKNFSAFQTNKKKILSLIDHLACARGTGYWHKLVENSKSFEWIHDLGFSSLTFDSEEEE